MAYRQIKLNVNPKALLEIARSKTGGMRRNLNSASPGQECWAACCGCCGCEGGCLWDAYPEYVPETVMPAATQFQSTYDHLRWRIGEVGIDCNTFPCMCIYPSSDPVEDETSRSTECQDCGTCTISPSTGTDEFGFPEVTVNCTGGCHCRGYTSYDINLGAVLDWDTRCWNTPGCSCEWQYIYRPDEYEAGAYGPTVNDLDLVYPCMKGGSNCTDCPRPDSLEEGCSGSCTYTWVPLEIVFTGYHNPTNNCSSGCGCNYCYTPLGSLSGGPDCIPNGTTISLPCQVPMVPKDFFHSTAGTRFTRDCTG